MASVYQNEDEVSMAFYENNKRQAIKLPTRQVPGVRCSAKSFIIMTKFAVEIERKCQMMYLLNRLSYQ